jgi:hypothetical protein
MIKTAIVALTVVGCDCDAKLCEYISETPAQWATLAECEAAMTAQIVKQGAYDYPLVTGVCRTAPTATPQMVSFASDGWSPGPSKASTPVPSEVEGDDRLALYDGVVEGTRMVFRKTGDGYEVVRSGFDRAAGTTIDLLRKSAMLVVPGN